MIKMKKIILASNSPRRKELLGGLDIPFEVKTINGLDESFSDDLKGEEIPLFLSEKKSDAYNEFWSKPDSIVITADTIVWMNNKVLGKPKSREEALEMLRSMSGKSHYVYTGVCVRSAEKKVSFVCSSEVRFANLDETEIEYYVDKYQPYDKAGSYGVQEWIGYIGVEHINGSFYNIMGLPIQRLYTVMKKEFLF
jgi:septum formation protein